MIDIPSMVEIVSNPEVFSLLDCLGVAHGSRNEVKARS